MTSTLWDAPYAETPVRADVRVPGSKSMTNRALLLGALAPGRSTLRHPLRSRDSAIMVDALRTIGTVIDDGADDAWTVDGGRFDADGGHIEVGNAGTVLRFVPPVAALTNRSIGFDGSEAIRRRPVAPLLDALRRIGAEVDDDGTGTLPFTVRGRGGMPGGTVSIDASSSSQLVSALLLAGASYESGVDVRHVGDRPVPNAPHLAMTVAMLRQRGVVLDAEPTHWRVTPGPVAAIDATIEPDLSSGATFAAAAVVTAGQVRIPGWPADSTQPGALLPALLERLGATTALDEGGLVVQGGDTVVGADLDLRNSGELTPVLAAVAATATSPSRFRGIEYLRGHETDRLAALAHELSRLGAEVRELDDGLEIVPKPLQGNVFSTYDDHRMAMAGAVLGLVVRGVQIENVETAAKTLPDFAHLWTTMVEGRGATH